MRNRVVLIAVLASMACTSAACLAQAPAKPGIDPALLAKANAGHADAEFQVGVKYELGAGVPKDPAQAAAWYRKAADQGNPEAEHSLGVLYETGNGVTLDASVAAQLYRKAADQGFAPAQFSLGLCYAHGAGVLQNYTEAVKWYEKAAEQKNTDALMNLAYLYHKGEGVSKDEARSVNLIRQAAEAGSPDAQFRLGMAYNDGDNGKGPDYDQARKWLLRSAEQGDVAAQFDYAMLVKAEPQEVYFWLGVAEPHLVGDTKKKTTDLRQAASAKLSPAQRKAVDDRIRKWHPVLEQQ